MTTAEHLALIDAVIANRMTGTAVEEYSEASERMKNTPLKDLYEIRDTLLDRLSSESGGTFSYGVPER